MLLCICSSLSVPVQWLAWKDLLWNDRLCRETGECMLFAGDSVCCQQVTETFSQCVAAISWRMTVCVNLLPALIMLIEYWCFNTERHLLHSFLLQLAYLPVCPDVAHIAVMVAALLTVHYFLLLMYLLNIYYLFSHKRLCSLLYVYSVWRSEAPFLLCYCK